MTATRAAFWVAIKLYSQKPRSNVGKEEQDPGHQEGHLDHRVAAFGAALGLLCWSVHSIPPFDYSIRVIRCIGVPPLRLA